MLEDAVRVVLGGKALLLNTRVNWENFGQTDERGVFTNSDRRLQEREKVTHLTGFEREDWGGNKSK